MTTSATVANSLQLGHGFHASELDRVVDLLSRLDDRLRSFGEDRVELQLGVKERDTASQRIVLESMIASWPTLVATSELSDVDAAIIEVRDEMIRQITDTKNRTEPKQNRQLRTR